MIKQVTKISGCLSSGFYRSYIYSSFLSISSIKFFAKRNCLTGRISFIYYQQDDNDIKTRKEIGRYTISKTGKLERLRGEIKGAL